MIETSSNGGEQVWRDRELEKYNGSMEKIDFQRCFDTVRGCLAREFNFEPHPVQFFLIHDLEGQQLYKDLLRMHGGSERAIDTCVVEMLRSNPSSCCHPIHDLRQTLGIEADYLIGLGNFPSADSLMIVLGEEVTHGKHACAMTFEKGREESYAKVFHEVTAEFVGRLGARYICSKLGLKAQEPCEVKLESDRMTDSDWNHFIGYMALQNIAERGIDLPAQELFHADDEEHFWNIVLRASGKSIELVFGLPEGSNLKPHEEFVDTTLKASRSDRAIHVKFEHSPTQWLRDAFEQVVRDLFPR